MKKTNEFPSGWDERRVREVLEHYENQTDEEAVAEHEAALARDRTHGKPLRLDPSAESRDPTIPAFLSRPQNAPVYHGFPVIPESETEGWVYGAITDYDTGRAEIEGDGFIIAPDGSRAGIAWATDTGDFYEISPPDDERWGVYGVRFPRPVSSLADLIENFRSVLPLFQARFRELKR